MAKAINFTNRINRIIFINVIMVSMSNNFLNSLSKGLAEDNGGLNFA